MLSLIEFSISGLSELTLSVDDGECIGITGASGCGKTRLLRAIADLDEHEGGLQLDDTHWCDVSANQWRQKVALLPSESHWWFDTISEHFTNNSEVINQLGFSTQTLQWDTVRCSSGEKQRLSILRLLANKPRVLLLDEPTANLDKTNSLLVEQLIADYIRENNAIAIWVSHNFNQLQRVTSRQFNMEDGRLISHELSAGNKILNHD